MSHEKGKNIEDSVCEWLAKQDIPIYVRNYRCPGGEIDIIAKHNDLLLFIEVKFRGKSEFGHANEMVTQRKKQKLLDTAALFLQQNPDMANSPCRFDLIAVKGAKASDFHWVKNIFEW